MDNKWTILQKIFFGMAIQAFIAGILSVTSMINLTATHQLIVSGLWVIILFVYVLITSELQLVWVGMFLMAFLSGSLGTFEIITVSAEQQFISCLLTFFCGVLALAIAYQEKKTGRIF